MAETRRLPAVDKRVETGPVQFGDDWTGLFIRGDNCFGLWMNLRKIVNNPNLHWLERTALEEVVELLASTNENKHHG